MRRTLIVTLFSTLFAIGCGEKDTTDTGTAEEGGGEEVDGAAVFSGNCSACHGADGSSGSAPDLSERVPSLSDSDLMDVLENGTGSMAAPVLTVAEEDALFLHLRERFGGHGGA